MVLHTGERWALEAGDDGDDNVWCPACEAWVEPGYERDEDGLYNEWCRICGSYDTRDSEEGEETA